MYGPTFKIGDRVARAVTSKDEAKLSAIIGWRRGVVTGVQEEKIHAMLTSTFWYTIAWDSGGEDGGYWEGGIVPESTLPPS